MVSLGTCNRGPAGHEPLSAGGELVALEKKSEKKRRLVSVCTFICVLASLEFHYKLMGSIKIRQMHPATLSPGGANGGPDS